LSTDIPCLFRQHFEVLSPSAFLTGFFDGLKKAQLSLDFFDNLKHITALSFAKK
jgi:hypothetical protein